MSAPDGGGRIQAAGACDVALLAELYGRCFSGAAGEGFAGTPWSARSLAEVMALPGVFALLALVEGEGVDASDPDPVGFLLAQVLFEEAELLTVGVLPACRRRGHAGRLLRVALAEAARRGGRQMRLEVAENNLGAQAFYRAAGFAPAGRRRNYYRKPDGATLDALVLNRPLDHPADAA